MLLKGGGSDFDLAQFTLNFNNLQLCIISVIPKQCKRYSLYSVYFSKQFQRHEEEIKSPCWNCSGSPKGPCIKKASYIIYNSNGKFDSIRLVGVIAQQLQEVGIRRIPCIFLLISKTGRQIKSPCWIRMWSLRLALHKKGSLHCLQFPSKWEINTTALYVIYQNNHKTKILFALVA